MKRHLYKNIFIDFFLELKIVDAWKWVTLCNIVMCTGGVIIISQPIGNNYFKNKYSNTNSHRVEDFPRKTYTTTMQWPYGS